MSSINQQYQKAKRNGNLDAYKKACRINNEPMLEVVGNFIIENDKILLLFKKARQYYELVGGKIDEGESIEEAAKREAKEEIGCDVLVLEYCGYADFVAGDDVIRGHHVRSKIVSGTPKITEPDVFDHYKWITIKELSQYPHSKNIDAFFTKHDKGI
jgi:8-oxo-dGTP diphosphatase